MLNVISLILSIVGAATGVLAYLHSKKVKATDLRLALRKALVEGHLIASALPAQIIAGNRSRRAVMAARGLNGSGVQMAWTAAIAADEGEVERLTAELRSEQADFSSLSDQQLEDEIVDVHRIHHQLVAFKTKYEQAFAEDDEQRRRIAQQMERRI